MKRRLLLIKALLLLFSCLIAISSAFMNRYPLVMSDTGAYLLSGFKNKLFNDRPIVYGLFVAHTSLHTTLWLTILAQSIILNYVIFKLIDLLRLRFPVVLTFLIVSFLTLFSALSSYCSEILPDIFTPICCLSLIFLLLANNIKFVNKIVISLIFILATLTHTSHLLVNFLTIAGFSLLYMLFFRRKDLAKIESFNFTFCWSLVIFCFIAQASINAAYGKGFKISNTNGFIIARIAESGVLYQLLHDKCQSGDYKFCEFKKNIPSNVRVFLWDSNSPFYKTGGWEDSSGEHNRIIKEVLITPKYLLKFGWSSVKSTFCQFFNFQAGDEIFPNREGSSPYNHIKWLIPNEFAAYTSADQYAGKLNFEAIDNLQQLMVYASFIIVVLFFYNVSFTQSPNIFFISVIIILFLFSNAAVCGTFSGVFNRYQGRVEWLIILLAIILLLTNNRIKWLIQK